MYLNSSLVDCCLLTTACFENQVLFCKCRQLKNTGKIFTNWVFNNTLHVRMDENGSVLKIYYSFDLENLMQVVNIDELKNNSSSYSQTLLKHCINGCEFYIYRLIYKFSHLFDMMQIISIKITIT